MLPQFMSLAESALGAESPEAASALFFESAGAFGASYLQTRLYRRPARSLTSASHWAAGGFVQRFSPPGWPDSAAFNYVCFECNPLLRPIREGRTRFRFSEFAPHGQSAFARYWDALGEAGVGEALGCVSYGPAETIASLHLGFPGGTHFSESEALMLHVAGLALTERLISLSAPADCAPVRLSERERDSLAYVAEGKTDWEVSVILGVSESTARFHVDNARRKLGAVNRAHAVARMAALRLI
jgi:LuxR family quorum sensing-dependent transcriptional regulator